MTAQDIVQIVTASAVIQCMCDIIAHYTIYATKSYQRLVDDLSYSKSKLDAAKSKVKASTTTTVVDETKNTKKTLSTNNNNNTEKQQKLIQRLEQDYANQLAAVAFQHFIPSFCTGILFLLLMRIFGTEHRGQIIAVLPFVPYKFIQRILSLRGLVIDPDWLQVGTEDVTATLFQDILSNMMLNDNNETTTTTIDATIPITKVTDTNGITHIGQFCSFTIIYMLTSMSVKYYVHQIFTTAPPKGAESYLSAFTESPANQALIKRTTGIDPNEYKIE